jgi:HD-GYP domain-containing protein (c-di-GMP phosphodiesterase class II)
MSLAPSQTEPTIQPGRFQKIPLVAIRLVLPFKMDLYCIGDGEREPRLLVSRSYNLTTEKIDDIEARGHRFLYVTGGDVESLAKELRGVLKKVQAEGKLPVEEQFALLQIAFSPDIERLFRKIYCDQYVDLARTIGRDIAGLFAGQSVSGPTLFQRMQHKHSNAVHLSNVAAYLVVFAQELGIKDKEKLEQIAIGGLLHGIGKLFVSPELYNKSGRLTPSERIEIESSPQLGYEYLLSRQEFEVNQLLMVYQHHERCDGSGYPVAILGEEIDPWARMLAIVDVFDRMTAARSNGHKIDCSEALLHLTEGADRHFDMEMVLCWVSIFQQA